jgi:tetratricopeptide (TPR) repeat protein
VPHNAVLVRLGNRQWRFVDLWYGSKNIRHKRLGLKVKRGGVWGIEDIELRKLGGLGEICYLPGAYVDAITLYIRGNRYLDRQDFETAIKYYSKALRLYPGNARFLYNRAIAYENLGEHEKALTDHAQALHDDSGIIRVLATEHNEVTSLIDLDAKGIDNLAQAIYLLYKGFATGKQVPLASIARKSGLSEAEVRDILSSVEAKLPPIETII